MSSARFAGNRDTAIRKGAVVYFVLGCTRSLGFIDEKETAVSIECESGDLIAVEGELASCMPFNVSTLPVDLPNHLRGVFSISYVLRFQWSHEHTCRSEGSKDTFENLQPFPIRIPSWNQYGVVGSVVEARKSGIDGAGLGLFLLKDFPGGGPVTEYDGSLRSNAKVVGKRDERTFHQQTSHWRTLPGCDFVIQGISQHEGLFDGRGGASLANHKKGNEANCKFDIIWTEREKVPRFCEDDGCFHLVPRIVLTLLAPAKKGTELFVDYGIDTAKKFMDGHSRHVLEGVGSKVGECRLLVKDFYNNSDQIESDWINPLPVHVIGEPVSDSVRTQFWLRHGLFIT